MVPTSYKRSESLGRTMLLVVNEEGIGRMGTDEKVMRLC